jgi:hypothetical protein
MGSDKLLKMLYILLVFLVGVIIGQTWNYYSSGGITGFSVESPSHFIENENILIYPDKVIIKVENAKLSNYDSTGSMIPVLDDSMSGISVVPESEEDINIGDIITFRHGESLIVHRVIEKGTDSDGVYFITKGDNSPTADGKIRFSEIERVLVAVVY